MLKQLGVPIVAMSLVIAVNPISDTEIIIRNKPHKTCGFIMWYNIRDEYRTSMLCFVYAFNIAGHNVEGQESRTQYDQEV